MSSGPAVQTDETGGDTESAELSPLLPLQSPALPPA